MGSEPSTKYPPGTVSHQEPPPGTLVPENSVVSYWLAATHAPPPSVTAPRITSAKPSVAKSRVYVPDVIGSELKQGSDAISNADLVPRFAGKERSNRRAGEIIHQRPRARTPVEPGSQVWVWVASGPSFPWAIILGALAAVAVAVVYVLVKIVKKLIWPVRVELCPVVDSGDQKLEKVVPLVAEGGD
jgi:beta-lactam-binding protein with PASTA domain